LNKFQPEFFYQMKSWLSHIEWQAVLVGSVGMAFWGEACIPSALFEEGREVIFIDILQPESNT
jgi:hypothetical protein